MMFTGSGLRFVRSADLKGYCESERGTTFRFVDFPVPIGALLMTPTRLLPGPERNRLN
jgi:hypothetical protein